MCGYANGRHQSWCVGRSRHPRTVDMKMTTVIAYTTMVVIGSSAPASGLHERADVVQGAGVEGQQIVVGLKVRPEVGRGVERLAEPPCHGAVDDLADRRHRRALPYPSRRVWTCQTSQIWYAPMSPKQSDFDSETAFIPHLSITQPDWNMNSTMSAYDIRLKPVCRGRRIRMSAHTSTWARCRCRRCAKSIAAFHASSQCATRKVLFIGELDRFGLSQQSFVEDDRSVFD